MVTEKSGNVLQDCPGERCPDDSAKRATEWQSRHPGWAIELVEGWHRVLDSARSPQAFALELSALLDHLETADTIVGFGTEDEQKSRLRAEFAGRWSLGVDHGQWEALPNGCLRPDTDLVKASESWLLAFRILAREAN